MNTYSDIITAARLAFKSTDPERQRAGKDWLRQLVAGLDEAPDEAPGDTWRMLQAGEIIEADDWFKPDANLPWRPVEPTAIGTGLYEFNVGRFRRRVVEAPAPVALPEGIPNPPDGFTYYGLGPLRVFDSRDNPDIAMYMMYGWNTSSWCGNTESHYALRTGSEIAKANGLP